MEEERLEFCYHVGNVFYKAYLDVRCPREGGPDVDPAKWLQGYLAEVAQSPETDTKICERWDLENMSQPAGRPKHTSIRRLPKPAERVRSH